MKNETLQNNLLYREQFEHDACGIGTVVSIKGVASRRIVDSALKIVEKLEHRAGKDAAGETGDGVGIIVATPHDFFKAKAAECGIALGGAREYGIGMLFLPQDKLRRAQAKKMMEIITAKEGLNFLGWRAVPTCPETLGQKAIDKKNRPTVKRGSTSTANSTWSAASLNSPMTTPMSALCPRERSSTRACSLSIS